MLGILGEHFDLEVIIVPFLALFSKVGDLPGVQIEVGTGFVEQVDGFIGEETISDIALGENDCLPCDFGCDLDTVIQLVIMGDAADDGDGLLNCRLRHGYGLEAALQGGVLFDILPVFCEGRRTDDLNFAARESGL